jgi:MerR family transcriptional regulator, copper efflux regulator
MTIKQLAQIHNVTPAAIRHYEKLGLFDDGHIKRLPNGYRVFGKEASSRLNLIKLGQMTGFSLRQMTTELRHWCDGGLSPDQKLALLVQQVKGIDQKIAKLEAMKSYVIQAAEAIAAGNIHKP